MTPKRRSILPWLLGGVVAVAIALALWRATRHTEPVSAPTPLPVPSTPAPPPAPVAKPEIRHPIEAVTVEPAPRVAPLPTLADSDGAIAEAAAALIGKPALARFFFSDEMVRRFVATVDNLPRESLPMKVRAVKAMPGRLAVVGTEDARSIGADNARRYEPFVRIVEAIDVRKLVSIYVRFYPLLQEQYRSLGYPKKHFNDRVIEAIDDLLDAPEPQGRVALVQPKVMYQYADADLESLSVGRKIMIRIGADNAHRLKVKLRKIRKALAGPSAAP